MVFFFCFIFLFIILFIYFFILRVNYILLINQEQEGHYISDQGLWCIHWAIAKSIHQGWGLIFFCNDRTDEVNKLSIIMAFSLWTWACHQLKPKTGQWVALKHITSMSCCTVAHDTVSCDTGQPIPLFDSSQLAITWMTIRMSTIKLCLGHLE